MMFCVHFSVINLLHVLYSIFKLLTCLGYRGWTKVKDPSSTVVISGVLPGFA